MRSLVLLVASLVAFGACSGDKPPEVDAGLPACTKAAYDPCNTEHDCTSGMCHLFTGEFQVCTQTCTMGGTPCPSDATGAAGQCNSMGICKPAAATACHL